MSSPIDVINVDDFTKIDDYCVVDVDSKLSSSAVSSSEEEQTDHVQRLKRRAIKDVKNGSPKTKQISKLLFKPYQEMVRSRSKYEDRLEMITMFMDKEDGCKEKFESIEAHETFKTIDE